MPIHDLPAPSSLPELRLLPSETVLLYPNAAWTGDCFTIKTRKFAPTKRHSLSGLGIQDNTTWIAFNLPQGTVMTLIDNYVPAGSGGPSDLKDAGRVVDLIGTGEPKAVDLTRCSMNDLISAFFWRQVDLDMGAIELYEDLDFKGNRTVLFPSEWSTGKVISLAGWYINDRLSSSRWGTLRDTQSAALFDQPDGGGKAYANISGYGETKEIKNFNDVGFNDCASAFSWESLVPKKEEIKKFDINLSDADVGNETFTAESSGENDSSGSPVQTVTINETDAETMTVTVSNAHTAGTKLGFSYSYKQGVAAGLGEGGFTISTELNYSYTRNDTNSKSATKTKSLTISQTFPAPPNSSYTGKLIARMGKLAPRPFSTTAKRWYSEPLPRTILDHANGWFVRDETITGTVEGRFACKAHVEVTSKPLVTAK
jgi:hypothetical protein